MKTGIKSFTLIEVVLAMMLAAIVIGMAYTAFTLFSRMYSSYEKKNIVHADVQTFRQMLNRDVENTSVVSLDNSELHFTDSVGIVTLTYLFGQDYLLRRNGNAQDTFKMKSLAVNTSFEGMEVLDGIVDHVLFRFEYQNEPLLINVSKIYTSADLFNYRNTSWKP